MEKISSRILAIAMSIIALVSVLWVVHTASSSGKEIKVESGALPSTDKIKFPTRVFVEPHNDKATLLIHVVVKNDQWRWVAIDSPLCASNLYDATSNGVIVPQMGLTPQSCAARILLPFESSEWVLAYDANAILANREYKLIVVLHDKVQLTSDAVIAKIKIDSNADR